MAKKNYFRTFWLLLEPYSAENVNSNQRHHVMRFILFLLHVNRHWVSHAFVSDLLLLVSCLTGYSLPAEYIWWQNYLKIWSGAVKICRYDFPGMDSHIKMTGVLSSCLLGGKNSDWVPIRVPSLKKFTAEAFAIPFRILKRKKLTGDNVLF